MVFYFLEQGLSWQKRVIPVIAAGAYAAYSAIAGIAVTSAQVTAGATVVAAGASSVAAGATAYMAYKDG